MLKIFLVWILEYAKNKEFVDINKRDLIKFQGYCLNTLGHSPNRVRTMRSAISSLSIYIENILDDVYPDFRNIVNKIESAKHSLYKIYGSGYPFVFNSLNDIGLSDSLTYSVLLF